MHNFHAEPIEQCTKPWKKEKEWSQNRNCGIVMMFDKERNWQEDLIALPSPQKKSKQANQIN